MAKRNTKTVEAEVEVLEAPIEATETEVAIDDEVVEQDIRRARSVVPSGYKRAYATRAVLRGATTRAAKRANGDWLARELEAECVSDGKTFDFDRFVAILEANGIDPARWPNRNNGWQGRLRMSGAIVLRTIVRASGVLRTPDGETNLHDLPEAASFLAKGA
jgi:hypothetical protein